MIEAVNLTKKFDDIVAVDKINAQIRDGSVFGLIGTNGAGKSTFLRMAAGVFSACAKRAVSRFFIESDTALFVGL